MRTEPATPIDLPAVRELYAQGRRTQHEHGSPVWPEFTDVAILDELATGRLMRVLDGEAVVGVFSVADEDPAIWGEHERGAHLYLHRIVRAAGNRGLGLVDTVLAWARGECRSRGREGLRLDTWAGSDTLIGYYQQRGFRLIASRRIGPDPRLLPHYHGLELALLEQPCAGAVAPSV